MAVLPILSYPDQRLYKVAKPVVKVDGRIHKLVNDMIETMHKASGIGLAATQVDVQERVVVISLSQKVTERYVLINPEITWLSKNTQTCKEGCLSIPGIYSEVKRSACIRCKALDISGQLYEIVAENLLAACIQHELDHLEGKIFIEYLSFFKQDRIRKKLNKMKHAAL